jgi:hypothetical protein
LSGAEGDTALILIKTLLWAGSLTQSGRGGGILLTWIKKICGIAATILDYALKSDLDQHEGLIGPLTRRRHVPRMSC